MGLGDYHSVILNRDGSVWSTAINLRGADSFTGVRKHFVKSIQSGAIAVAAGAGHTIALKQDGGVWTMGRNYLGQLGDGSQARKNTFSLVKMIPGAKAAAAGGAHSMVLTKTGQVWVTGWNKHGQLGIGDCSSVETSFRFRLVMSEGAGAVTAGEIHSVVLKCLFFQSVFRFSS